MLAEARTTASRTLSAGAWSIGSRLAAKVIDLSMLICLARFLGPAEFGLVATAMAAVFVVEALFELPTAAALIRLPTLTHDLLHTAFTLSLLRGLVVAILLGASAVPLAAFNNEPRLVSLLAVLSLAPAFRGLVSPRLVEYTRRLDFRPDAVMELSGKVVALVLSVVIAIATHSYWAIAVATICAPLVSTVLSYVIAPLKPRLTLRHWDEFSNVICWNFVAQFGSALNWQIDRLVLPRFSSISSFGQYAMARQVSEIPIQALVAPLVRPTMAALASAGDRRGSRYLHLSQAVASMILPVLGIAIIWPDAIVRIGLGPNWTSAVEWLRWVSAAAVITIPTMLLNPLAMNLNQTRWLAVRTGIELLIRVPLVWMGAAYYAIPGAIAGGAIANACITAVSLYIVRSLIDVRMTTQFMALWRPMLALIPAGSMLLIASRSSIENSGISSLILKVTLYVTFYFLIYGVAVLLAWHLAGRPEGFEKLLVDKIWASLTKVRDRKSRIDLRASGEAENRR